MALKIEKPALKFTGSMTMNNAPKYIIIHHAAISRCTIEIFIRGIWLRVGRLRLSLLRQ